MLLIVMLILFFFFKQKTAYEMVSCDWSSDVCSSDLGATGGLDTDMIAKADAAMDALRTHELVVLHVKAPDLCGHDGKASEKIRVIERMDAMMGHLKAMLSTDVVVALTADHSTPVALKDHSGDPVPLTIFGEGVRVDD